HETIFGHRHFEPGIFQLATVDAGDDGIVFNKQKFFHLADGASELTGKLPVRKQIQVGAGVLAMRWPFMGINRRTEVEQEVGRFEQEAAEVAERKGAESADWNWLPPL